MAAGLGFKDFVTGEVLTAADVDGYLMQGVWVFASAAARDAAVTAPSEGNFAYLKDTNVTTYYTGSAWANLDTTGMTNPMTTTGDTIYSSSGSTPARLGIGSTGQVLTVAAGVPSWATPAAGGASFVGASAIASSNQTVSNATETAINFDGTDLFDTDAYHNPSSNNSRMTIPAGKAGKYAVYGRVNIDTTSTSGRRIVEIYKNGAQVPYLNIEVTPISDQTILTAGIINLAVDDYIEIYFYQTSGISLTLYGGYCGFSIQYLGA